MNFPTKLLPNPSYRTIDCDLSRYYLIRSTKADSVHDIVNHATGFIKFEHICTPRDHISDLSTSLLGVFEIPHVQIQLTEEGKTIYNEYCQPNVNAGVPVFEKDFVVDTSKLYWVVLIGLINKMPVHYTKGDLPFKAQCVVEHTPMKWNFWHFSVRWLTEDGFFHSLSENERKKLVRRLAHDARAQIAMFATIEEPNYLELDKNEYMV